MKWTILCLSALYFLGHALRSLHLRFRIPDGLLYVLLGLALPAVWPGVVKQSAPLLTGISELALLGIVFLGGLSFRFSEVFKTHRVATALSGIQFLVVGLCGSGLFLVTLPTELAVLCGFSLVATSGIFAQTWLEPSLVSSRTRDLAAREARWGESLAVLFLGTGMVFWAQRFSALPIALDALWGVALGLFLGLWWSLLAKGWRAFDFIPLVVEGWWAFAVGLSYLFPINPFVACFTLGVVQAHLSNVPPRAQDILSAKNVKEGHAPFLQEFLFVVRNLLLVFLGTYLVQGHPPSTIFLGLGFAVLLYGVRYLAIYLCLSPERYSRLDAMTLWAPASRGLAPLAFGILLLTKGEVGTTASVVVFSSVLFSLFIASVLVPLMDRPSVRLSAQKLFGHFKEDFGLGISRAAPSDEFSPPPEKKEKTKEKPTEPSKPRLSQLKIVFPKEVEEDEAERVEPVFSEPVIEEEAAMAPRKKKA